MQTPGEGGTVSTATTGTAEEEEEMAVNKVDVHGIHHCQNMHCRVTMSRDYNVAINIRRNLLFCIENGHWDPRFSKKKEDDACQQQQTSLDTTATT